MASHLFLSHKLKQNRLNLWVFVTGVLVTGVLLTTWLPQIVGASGIGTGGGSGAGTSSCKNDGSFSQYCGWGWVDYPLTALSGPTYNGRLHWQFKNPNGSPFNVSYWGAVAGNSSTNISSTCSDASATGVMVFVYGNYRGQTLGYKYQGLPANSPGALPPGTTVDGTGTSVALGTAKSDYDSLPASLKSGYTWGNNVAWFCWDFKPKDYSLSASSSTNITTAKPGDTIKWTHTLTNNGPNPTSSSTHSNLGMSGFSNGWGSPSQEWAPGDTPAGAAVGTIRTITSYATYTVTSADVGNTLCQWVQYDPQGSNGARDGRGNHACVDVPYNYNLNPSVSLSKTTASVGDSVYVSPSVNNSGATKSNQTNWSLITFTVAPGGPIPSGGTGSQAPTSRYAGSTTVDSGGNAVFNTGITSVSAGNQTVPDKPVGSRVCWVLSVQPYSQSTTDWRYSTPMCLVVSKSPRVQVWGSDLWVGAGGITSNVITSLTGRGSDNRTYGSWAEYAIAASGTSKTMASGSALNNGTAGTPWSGKNCSVIKETFTNAGSTGCSGNTIVGGYNTLNSLPNVSASFKVTNGSLPGSPVDVSTLATGVYSGSGTISLSAATLSDKWIVINAPGAIVNITGDLKYTNATLNSAASLPQLVIIANTINIAGGVKQVDAWLVARPTGANTSAPNGSIYTCSDVANASSLNANTCGNSLTVNGPVSAQHLFLYRTAGAGTGNSIGDPAEVFNLRPDAYMWAYQRASASNQVSTMQTKELPPRF